METSLQQGKTEKIDMLQQIQLLNLKSDIIPIDFSKIVFSPLTQLLCQNCGMYGKTYRCPPLIPKYYQTKESLSKYNNHILIIRTHPIEDTKSRKQALIDKYNFTKYKSEYFSGQQVQSINLSTSLTDLRTVIKFLREKSIPFKAFGSGGCHKCHPCKKSKNEPCAYPQDSFSSPEGSGIDLYSTLKNINIPFETPPINTYVAVCLISF